MDPKHCWQDAFQGSRIIFTHTAHDAEDVVVDGVDRNLGGGRTVEVERGVVDAAHVARARRLVFRRLEAERVDTGLAISRDTRVVLVRLNLGEVFGFALGEAVVSVELELGVTGGGNRNTLIILLDPHKFLARVVEVEANFATITRQRVFAVELDLLDEVFVADLGEAAAFVRVEVDVVDVELGVFEFSSAELNVDLDFVVLESDERKRKSGVAAEPELERDEEGLSGAGLRLDGVDLRNGWGRVGVGRDRIHGWGAGSGSGHVSVSIDLAVFLGEFVPQVHPFAGVLVDTLSANFDFDVVDQVANVNCSDIIGIGACIHIELKVAAADEVAVARDGAGDLGASGRVAVEGLFDGFHREVGVAAVDHLEEGDLGVTGQVNILGAVSDELHESSSHCISFFYTFSKENNFYKKKRKMYLKSNAEE